jgi:hypothetical protein
MKIILHIVAIFVLALSALAQQTQGNQRDEDSAVPRDGQSRKIAVMLAEVNADAVIGDPDGKRFLHEVEDQLQASDTFYWWSSNAEKLPNESLRILVASVEVKDTFGNTLGSAIVLTTGRICDNDKEAQRQIDVRTYFVKHEESVASFVRQYFEDIRDKV